MILVNPRLQATIVDRNRLQPVTVACTRPISTVVD